MGTSSLWGLGVVVSTSRRGERESALRAWASARRVLSPSGGGEGRLNHRAYGGELVLFVFSFWPFYIFLDFEAVCISDEKCFCL